LHPSGIAKSSTSFGWGKGWNVTSAGWQVTLCDPLWHVSSSSGVATTVSELLYPSYFTLLFTTSRYCNAFANRGSFCDVEGATVLRAPVTAVDGGRQCPQESLPRLTVREEPGDYVLPSGSSITVRRGSDLWTQHNN